MFAWVAISEPLICHDTFAVWLMFPENNCDVFSYEVFTRLVFDIDGVFESFFMVTVSAEENVRDLID